jgi:hypothetical protein
MWSRSHLNILFIFGTMHFVLFTILCALLSQTSVSWISSSYHNSLSPRMSSKFRVPASQLLFPKVCSSFHPNAVARSIIPLSIPNTPFVKINWQNRALELLNAGNKYIHSKNGLHWFPIIGLTFSRGAAIVKEKSERFPYGLVLMNFFKLPSFRHKISLFMHFL